MSIILRPNLRWDEKEERHYHFNSGEKIWIIYQNGF
jgi:hypothetical protein